MTRPASARRERRAAPSSASSARAGASRSTSSHSSSSTSSSGAASVPGPERAAAFVIILLLVITPLLVRTDLKESFRLVQGLVSGWLGLASLAVASLLLRQMGPQAGAVTAASIWRQPAVRALAPLLIVVAIGGFFTSHAQHFRAAFVDLTIGVTCVIGWSLALRESTLRRVLTWTLPPAVLVALLGLDQFAGQAGTGLGLLYWLQVNAPTARLRLTSTVGNPGDLASFLVLPSLIALSRLRAANRRERIALSIALVVMLSMMAITATLAAVAAVIVASGVWWWLSSPWRRQSSKRALVAIALILAAGAIVVSVSSPLRARVDEKVGQLANGDINALLTGRLDGWRTAWAMLKRAPITGVGQGAFRAEFADTRLALTAQGVPFYGEQTQVVLATPHNEALSVAAEQGLPGLAALGWALWCVGVAAGRIREDARALVWSGLVALGLLAMFSFPLHVAAVAWPWLLFLAWVFRLSSASVTGSASASASASASEVRA